MNVSVAELGVAPGKSMRAQEGVEALHFDIEGMFGDREYMWVEAGEHENVLFYPGDVVGPGHFLSQREDPVLTSIAPELGDSGLHLNSVKSGETLYVPSASDKVANRIPVSVWGWQGRAVDQGDEAATWGEEHIGRPVRLVEVSNKFPRYAEDNPDLGRVGFADGFPLLVTSTASIAELNEYLTSVGKPAIPANRFRANIILDGVEPFGEDLIDSFEVASSGLSIVIKRMKACSRCPIPDTDQMTGERKTHVRSALGKIGRKGIHTDVAKYGDKPEIFFGQNFVVEMDSEMDEAEKVKLAVGQEATVNPADSANWVAV